MTPHVGFGHDGVHIQGYLLYLKVQWYKTKKVEEKEERRIRGGERMRGGCVGEEII